MPEPTPPAPKRPRTAGPVRRARARSAPAACARCEQLLAGIIAPTAPPEGCQTPTGRHPGTVGIGETESETPAGPRGNQSDSVWLTGQVCSREQRKGRYLPESVYHPGKMLPEIARHAIAKYTAEGDWVADPMAGIGTTVIEAMHAGRNGFGIEYEQRWATLGAANIRHAESRGAAGRGQLWCGDGRQIARLVPAELHGQIALVITSPPYGPSTHGRAMTGPYRSERKVVKVHHKYGDDKGNLAYAGHDQLADGFAAILAGCASILRPGGIVAVTARPYRRHGELVDIPGLVIAAGQAAGLTLVDRIPALLCGLRGGRIVARGSFFQIHNLRQAHADGGPPLHVVAHEDLIIFGVGSKSGGSSEPKCLGGSSPHGGCSVPGQADHRLDVSSPIRMDRRPQPAQPVIVRRGRSVAEPRPHPGREPERTPDPCPPYSCPDRGRLVPSGAVGHTAGQR